VELVCYQKTRDADALPSHDIAEKRRICKLQRLILGSDGVIRRRGCSNLLEFSTWGDLWDEYIEGALPESFSRLAQSLSTLLYSTQLKNYQTTSKSSLLTIETRIRRHARTSYRSPFLVPFVTPSISHRCSFLPSPFTQKRIPELSQLPMQPVAMRSARITRSNRPKMINLRCLTLSPSGDRVVLNR